MSAIGKDKAFRKLIVIAFLSVPFFSSIISTLHVVELFGLGNITWMAIILAVVFEVGQLSSLMTLMVMDKINKFLVWMIFFVLAAMQIIGNVYSTYHFMTSQLAINADWLKEALELINNFTYGNLEVEKGKFILSLVLGVPIPLISMAFLKSLTDYLKPSSKAELIEVDETITNIKTPKEVLQDIEDSETDVEQVAKIEDESLYPENDEVVGELKEINEDITLEKE